MSGIKVSLVRNCSSSGVASTSNSAVSVSLSSVFQPQQSTTATASHIVGNKPQERKHFTREKPASEFPDPLIRTVGSLPGFHKPSPPRAYNHNANLLANKKITKLNDLSNDRNIYSLSRVKKSSTGRGSARVSAQRDTSTLNFHRSSVSAPNPSDYPHPRAGTRHTHPPLPSSPKSKRITNKPTATKLKKQSSTARPIGMNHGVYSVGQKRKDLQMLKKQQQKRDRVDNAKGRQAVAANRARGAEARAFAEQLRAAVLAHSGELGEAEWGGEEHEDEPAEDDQWSRSPAQLSRTYPSGSLHRPQRRAHSPSKSVSFRAESRGRGGGGPRAGKPKAVGRTAKQPLPGMSNDEVFSQLVKSLVALKLDDASTDTSGYTAKARQLRRTSETHRKAVNAILRYIRESEKAVGVGANRHGVHALVNELLLLLGGIETGDDPYAFDEMNLLLNRLKHPQSEEVAPKSKSDRKSQIHPEFDSDEFALTLSHPPSTEVHSRLEPLETGPLPGTVFDLAPNKQPHAKTGLFCPLKGNFGGVLTAAVNAHDDLLVEKLLDALIDESVSELQASDCLPNSLMKKFLDKAKCVSDEENLKDVELCIPYTLPLQVPTPRPTAEELRHLRALPLYISPSSGFQAREYRESMQRYIEANYNFSVGNVFQTCDWICENILEDIFFAEAAVYSDVVDNMGAVLFRTEFGVSAESEPFFKPS